MKIMCVFWTYSNNFKPHIQWDSYYHCSYTRLTKLKKENALLLTLETHLTKLATRPYPQGDLS
jgi:hypothetical protein